jgi:hypothetical protein
MEHRVEVTGAPPPEKNIGRISQRFAHFCKNFAVCSFSAKT